MTGSIRYRSLLREHPPFSTCLIRKGEWWGCSHWLLKTGEPQHEYPVRDVDRLDPPILLACHLSKGVRTGFIARFSASQCLLYVEAALPESWAVQADYLDYCEASAEVEEWQWVPGFGGTGPDGEKHPDAGMLAGLRSDELVAIVAPVKAKEALRAEADPTDSPKAVA